MAGVIQYVDCPYLYYRYSGEVTRVLYFMFVHLQFEDDMLTSLTELKEQF